MKLTHRDGRLTEYAFSNEALPSIDLFKEMKRSGGGSLQNGEIVLESPEAKQAGINTPIKLTKHLPFAAPHYHISRDFNDYVLTPVIIMPSDLPNRNAIAFPLKELVKFHPQLGQQAYETWSGKPTFYEHKNDDITKAYGMIGDTFMRKMTGWGNGRVWKILLLLGFDRSKNPHIVNRILDGSLNSYSMGAYIGGYTCSICNAERGKCHHIDPHDTTAMYEIGNQLVYSNVVDIEGFETSAVESPAYMTALSDTLIRVRPQDMSGGDHHG
jgi:hypothetical protein